MDRSLQQLYTSMPRNSHATRMRPIPPTSRPASPSMKKTGMSQGRFSLSARSNPSIVGIRSEFNMVESFGLQLPVLVNEALTFNEKNQNVSVRCAPNGWAWVVHGRRLLIWQYKDARRSGENTSPRTPKELLRAQQRRGAAMAQCRELTLSHCDIGHKASLVSVFLGEGQQMASCVAVSPTGDVRYWPSIAHDGSSVDLSGILDGQEFDQMLNMPHQQGYLLVTTTCNLVLLQLQVVNGRHVLQHKTIRQAAGFLGGIGKKFSIIMGMNSGSDKENKFVGIACEEGTGGEAFITVLADRWFQRWRLANGGTVEQLLYEDVDVIRKIRDEFQHKFWNVRDSLDINLHLLDMHICDGKIYVLGGAVNTAHAPQIHYAVAILASEAEGMKLQSFIPLKLTQFYNIGTEKDCHNLRFIVTRTHLFFYTDKYIYPLNLANPAIAEMEAEKIEFHLQDDRILNAAVCGHLPLFFSRSLGLLCVTPGDFDTMDFLNSSYTMGPSAIDITGMSPMGLDQSADFNSQYNESNLYMLDLDPDALYNEFKDEVSQLKAAFIYRLKHNNNMCNTILNDLLRNISEGQTGSKALPDANQLDRIVITIAEDLAEDLPAADPRWEQLWTEGGHSNKHALGSSSSLQILTQLKEKSLALRHFVEFLHNTGIWEKLEAVPSGGGSVLKPTCYILADIYEKLVAAIALRTIQNKYGKIIDEAINRVVSTWQENPCGNLTPQDLFYVRLCKFQEIFHALSEFVDNRIESQQQTTSLASLISDINSIVLHVIGEVLVSREHNSSLFTLQQEKANAYEYLPWTAMSGSVGLRDALSHLIDASVRYGAHCTNEPELKQRLFKQIFEMIDAILEGRKNYLDSVRDSEKYNVLLQQFESQRRDLISILIEDEQYEYAAKLAEKFLDFQSLVVICDETKNQDRLDAYIKKYEEYDFSQFAINWHLRQNRQGEVFERFKGNQAALSQFMRDHPTLGWIQLVFNGDFERAAKILLQLAQNETEFVQRKKSMLSLAKLSAFASADSDLAIQLESINAELNIIDYQEQLSETLLQNFGYDVENAKVLKVDEIINLFISEENETANEFDFRKALELLNYLDEPYDVRHKIWCASILRDNWTAYDTNNAVDYLQNLLFFKLVEVCHLMDGDCETFLPPMDDFLNSHELGDLVHNTSFQYLFKLTYEYISDAFKKPAGMEL
ncbi:PREDICTED: nuclear pore complex protein Nup133 isoform X2 [Rhagoletis zephyria]|uniref:nuclear pore complex protein Nup133 isoform X1 n=1 Tax=Rhagoletis zephyria TaxID=28612 RepID=UPI000811A35F|nr:PREDICTED: nuclear pore complex protein Nup133 isoform X1 [Rhagoletis zephyria]XP_017488988.1 PREDICTED: nuclear pore complex protein Nup133 isoform X2 [Rhagoletis zephyria]